MAIGAILAAVLGVAGCDPPNLDPLPAPTDPQYADAAITRQVAIELDRDLKLRPFRINVQTTESVVYLQGALPSEGLRQRAERLAGRVPNVLSVRNNIIVVPGPPEGEGP